MRNKLILVTGGAGFIGSSLVDRLITLGNQVTIIDNLSSGYRNNVSTTHPQLEFIEGDIRDSSLTANIVSKVDIILHFAANANVPYSIKNTKYELNDVKKYNIVISI